MELTTFAHVLAQTMPRPQLCSGAVQKKNMGFHVAPPSMLACFADKLVPSDTHWFLHTTSHGAIAIHGVCVSSAVYTFTPLPPGIKSSLSGSCKSLSRDIGAHATRKYGVFATPIFCITARRDVAACTGSFVTAPPICCSGVRAEPLVD